MIQILLSTSAVPVILACLSILYVSQRLLDVIQAAKVIDLPGYRTFLDQSGVLANAIPPISGLATGRNYLFLNKHRVFKWAGWDIHSAISFWPKANTTLILADAAAIKEVVQSRARFPKPVKQYRIVSFYGKNIVASKGEEWKRYRKIAAPAFSDRNNKLVWGETIKIMESLFDTALWEDQDMVTIDHIVDLTLPIALFVIGVAGFGRQITWEDDRIIPQGHQMTFKDALHIVTSDLHWKLIVPKWAFRLNQHLQRVQIAFEELEQYILEMIRDRKASGKNDRFDLFTSLLDANELEDDDNKLTDSELVGNIFIFLLAGHETTAHTLAFTLALLALHQDEQDILFQHLKDVLPSGVIPSYEEMSLLTHPLAVMYETLRMFPPVPGVPKYSAEDTVLVAGNAAGAKKIIAVPQGTNVVLDAAGLHYNPRYWENPLEFKPSRFLGDWPRDAFIPFSAGARACIGKKFFETEGVVILTMLISRYKVTVKEEPAFANETFEEKKTRILSAKPGITLTPIRVPLVFKRR